MPQNISTSVKFVRRTGKQDDMLRAAHDAALKKVVSKVETLIKRHFFTRQSEWKALAPMTQRERQEFGFNPTTPKLVRTGTLRDKDAVQFAYVNRQHSGNFTIDTVVVGTNDPIAIANNDGDPRTNLPARNFYRMDSADIAEIRKAYVDGFKAGTANFVGPTRGGSRRTTTPIKAAAKTHKPTIKQKGQGQKRQNKFIATSSRADAGIKPEVRKNLRENKSLLNKTNIEKHLSPESRASWERMSPAERERNRYMFNVEVYLSMDAQHRENYIKKEIRRVQREQDHNRALEIKKKNDEVAAHKADQLAKQRAGVPTSQLDREHKAFLEGEELPDERLRNYRQMAFFLSKPLDTKLNSRPDKPFDWRPYHKSQIKPEKRPDVVLKTGVRKNNRAVAATREYWPGDSLKRYQALKKESGFNLSIHDFLDAHELELAEQRHRESLGFLRADVESMKFDPKRDELLKEYGKNQKELNDVKGYMEGIHQARAGRNRQGQHLRTITEIGNDGVVRQRQVIDKTDWVESDYTPREKDQLRNLERRLKKAKQAEKALLERVEKVHAHEARIITQYQVAKFKADVEYDTTVHLIAYNRAIRNGKQASYPYLISQKKDLITPPYLREKVKGVTIKRTAQNWGHYKTNLDVLDKAADALRSRKSGNPNAVPRGRGNAKRHKEDWKTTQARRNSFETGPGKRFTRAPNETFEQFQARTEDYFNKNRNKWNRRSGDHDSKA